MSSGKPSGGPILNFLENNTDRQKITPRNRISAANSDKKNALKYT